MGLGHMSTQKKKIMPPHAIWLKPHNVFFIEGMVSGSPLPSAQKVLSESLSYTRTHSKGGHATDHKGSHASMDITGSTCNVRLLFSGFGRAFSLWAAILRVNL